MRDGRRRSPAPRRPTPSTTCPWRASSRAQRRSRGARAPRSSRCPSRAPRRRTRRRRPPRTRPPWRRWRLRARGLEVALEYRVVVDRALATRRRPRRRRRAWITRGALRRAREVLPAGDRGGRAAVESPAIGHRVRVSVVRPWRTSAMIVSNVSRRRSRVSGSLIRPLGSIAWWGTGTRTPLASMTAAPT